MDINNLKKEIPYKWRVQSYSKFKPSASCVAYIDARDVMDLLDNVVGPENWQNQYKIVGNDMVAGIGIKCGDDWVWKWDTGAESNIDAEKGHMSDAFKRACVKWGVGRFLYDLDIQHVDANEKKSGGNYPYPVDKNGKRVYDLTEFINNRNKPAPPPPDYAEIANKMMNDINECKALPHLANWWKKHSSEVAALPAEWSKTVTDCKDKKKASLTAALKGDE